MIPRDGFGRTLLLAHIVLTVLLWLVPLIVYNGLPAEIPVHFDATGTPDRWSAKTGIEFWLTPIVASALAVLFIVLLRWPQTYNYPRKNEVLSLPPVLREPVYDVLRQMMLAIAVAMDGLMLYVIIMIVAGARHSRMPISWVVIGAFVIAPLAIVILFLVRIGRAIDLAKSRPENFAGQSIG